MTATNAAASGATKDRPQMMLTLKEAMRADLCTKETWLDVEPLWRLAVKHHQAIGTPRDKWEPPALVIHQLVQKYLQDGKRELDLRIDTDVAPALDEEQTVLEEAREHIDGLEDDRPLFSTAEANTTHTLPDSVQLVRADDGKIIDENNRGIAIHVRTPFWLKILGKWAPWVEALGFLFFVAYYINVPLLEPWVDPLAWTFTMAVVVIIILGQKWLVDHAARAHNLTREQVSEGQRHEAERSETNRGWYLAGTAVTAASITGGMIQRGLVSIGEDAGIWVMIVMTTLAATVGLLMPTLAYLAQALDGSKVSRRRDALAADLDDHKAEQEEGIDAVKQLLGRAAEIERELAEKVFPEIITAIQDAVNEGHVAYNFLRTQIGGLTADPPARPSPDLQVDLMAGSISCGLPGADVVSLRPLGDEERRLHKLAERRAELEGRLAALPPHPWAQEA